MAEDAIQFNRDIRPILAANCFQCHGPDKNRCKADMRLDIREEAIKSGAFQPGKPDRMPLVARIFSEEDDQMMPPPTSNKKLTAEQKALASSAGWPVSAYQGHWAYEKPVKAEVPPGVNGVAFLGASAWPRWACSHRPRPTHVP